MLLTQTLLSIIYLNLIATQTLNNCKSKEKCSDCIQELGCIWCINPLINSEIHCVHKTEASHNWCNIENTVDPRTVARIVQNDPLSSLEGKTVQIKPQKVQLKLRRGEEFQLNFQYAQAENYPVDLYYIMDLSASMESHREKLGSLGVKLAKTMMNITNNFQLGFGSFVDKVDLPFVSTVPEKLIEPCVFNKPNGIKVKCVSPYSFKSHMKLTNSYQKFSEEVTKARVSGNLDAPEGGFDALMQAMVCKDVIGWRSQARHMVVFSTDAHFHIAGDGKLAGVVEPNDGQCYMTNNFYTRALKYDYPSVSQINAVAKENNINIVFAIVNKKHIVDAYRNLSLIIENSNMGTLDDRSENVIKLVVENYNKIVDSVTISSNSTSDVEVKISSNCQHTKSNVCNNIHVGEIVNFTATIKPLICSKNSMKTIAIKPEGLDESIIIELEIICDCDCESSSSKFYLPNAAQCSTNGTLKCGVCDCLDGFFGKKCECSREASQTNDVTFCKANQTSDILCSGLGVCRCGQCQCNKRANPEEKIFGKYCDCDNYSCKKVNGKLCSQRGTCECNGYCNCEAGWIGDACECPASNNSCIKPDGKNLICNGHGSCNCGQCDCFDENVRYSGKFCDECPTCEGQRCQELRPCVECQVHKSGKYGEIDCIKNCNFTAIVVEHLDEGQDGDTKTCTFVDENDCTFVFQYEYLGEEEVRVTAEKNKSCREPPDVLAWVLSVIGSILLVGLISLLIWKVFTTLHDHREYVKFENERQKLRWHTNENPLYKGATSTFKNPLYSMSNLLRNNKN